MRDQRLYIFDCCHRYAQECRAAESGLGAIDPGRCGDPGGKPRVGNLRAEYLAEFAVAGKRTLFPWKPRLELFRRYYVDGLSYRAAMDELQVSDRTFRFWCGAIKRSVAPELVRRGLYPPSQYKVPTLVPDDESQYTTQLLVAD